MTATILCAVGVLAEKEKQYIERWDADGDGSLNADEQAAIPEEARCVFEPETYLLQRYDQDGDGRLSDEEYAAIPRPEEEHNGHGVTMNFYHPRLRQYQMWANGKWVADITKPDGLATTRKDFSWDPGAQIRHWGAYGGVLSIWNTNPGLWDTFVDFGFLKGNFIGLADVTWNGFSTIPTLDLGLRVEPKSTPKRPGKLESDFYVWPVPLYRLDFKECVAVGRLEIDGFVADEQTGDSTLSTRDKFPLVRVNCEEEIRGKDYPEDENKEIYEVTVGEAAIAELTFRAQPGEWVLAAVGVADKDGNPTDEAWVTFDADERFERKKDKPQEVFLVKKDGTKVPAKRLISTKLVVPDNAQWCASKKVYIHCLKANDKPYDYKVVVWGQERYSKTETGLVHHDQSLRRWWTNKETGEEKAEPIEKWLKEPWIPRLFRWYVTDQERFNAVKLDLDVDSDNDNGFDPPARNWAEESIEDDEGKPGKYVAINDFDLDGDGIPGFADGFDADGVPGNDDDTPDGAKFVPVVMALSQNINLDTAKIRIKYSNSDPFQVAQNGQVWVPGPGALRLWLVDGIFQRNPLSIDMLGDYVPSGIYPANIFAWVEVKAERTVTLYLEGIKLSEKLGDQRITLELSPEGEEDEAAFELLDAVRVTVIGVDLDVDSNNDGVISNPNPNAEDQSEDIKDNPEFPGKYVGVNDGDVDNDGVPNWADGFKSRHADNSGPNAGGSFTEMILSVPEPVDLTAAKLRFTYLASDPFEVSRTGAGTPADPFVYTPAPGYLRVWTKDGNVSRNAKSIAEPGGHFVASNTSYTAAQLGLAPATRTVTLYIEGIRPSDSVADQRINVELDPDGDGPASWVHDDAVRVTIIKVEFIECDETVASRIDLLPIFNPSPIVILDAVNPPGGRNPTITVSGIIKTFIAPIEQDHVFINGVQAANVTLTASGTDNLGPFTHTFASNNISLGDDDFAIVVTAANAVENFGYDSVDIEVDRGDHGQITGRRVTPNGGNPSVPDQEPSLEKFRFKIEVVNAAAFASKLTVDVTLDTGEESKTVTLDKNENTGSFRSKDLYLIPENSVLPQSTPLAVLKTRFKARFGKMPKVAYYTAQDVGITTGIRFVRQNRPTAYIQSAAAQDVINGGADISITVEAGVPGCDNDEVVKAEVESLNKFMQALPTPEPQVHYAPSKLVQAAGNEIHLKRVNSADPASSEYNYYKQDLSLTKPLLALRTQMPLNLNGVPQNNPEVVPFYVNYRGYAKLTTPVLSDVEKNVEPISGLQTMVAFPADIDADTDLHPPMKESDFIPIFDPSPIVLITAPADGAIGAATATVEITGEIISFSGPIPPADVTVNGVQVTTYALDANNPPTGPWRATFAHTVAIDRQMKDQTAVVAAVDKQRNMGRDSIRLEAVGGGRGAAGEPVAVTDRNLINGPTLPAIAAMANLADNNTITLKEALVYMRNRQFRIEGNPVLRGTLGFMINTTEIRTSRQTDGAGTIAAGSAVALPLAIPSGGDTMPAGGGFATGRFVLLHEPPAGQSANANQGQVRGNFGQFLRSEVNGVATLRAETASPEGVLIFEHEPGPSVLTSDVIIPGHQADVGQDPQEIAVMPRVSVSGFDEATGAGRPTVATVLRSLTHTGGDLPQPASRQLSRNDLQAPAGAVDRQQWENFALVEQNLTFHRLSDDPTHPNFNVFRYKKPDPSNNEEVITPVSTGTFPAGAARDAADVSGTVDRGLHYVQTGGWLRLECAQVREKRTFEPVYGPFVSSLVTSMVDAPGFGTPGAEQAQNFETDKDFCVQVGERPICRVEIVAPPSTPANNFLLRIERTAVDNATDLVPAQAAASLAEPATGFQIVAYLDAQDAAGFQHQATVRRTGAYRFPPIGATHAALIRPGTADAAHVPACPAAAARGVSQTTFEGLNLPNIELPLAVAGGGDFQVLPPGRYYIRPVMLSPEGGGRYVLGNAVTVTVPQIKVLDFAAKANAFDADLRDHFALTTGAGAADLRNAVIRQLVRLIRDDYGIRTGGSGANERPIYVAGSANTRFFVQATGTAFAPLINQYVRWVDIGGGNEGSDEWGLTRIGFDGLVLNWRQELEPDALRGAGRGIFPRGFVNSGFLSELNSIFDPFTGTAGAAVANVLRRADGAAFDYWFDNDGSGTFTLGDVTILDANGNLALGDAGVAVNVRQAQLPLVDTYWVDNAGGTADRFDAGDTLIVQAAGTTLWQRNPYGSDAGDVPANITAMLNGATATVPAFPAVPPRELRAQNAFVAFCRIIAVTTSHEIGHSLGLLSLPSEVGPGAAAYLSVFGIPAGRAANFCVGSDVDDIGHNGQRGGEGPGVHATYPGGAGVANVDDLGIVNTLTQNYIMDSGLPAFHSISEWFEAGASGVTASPPLVAEPVGTFTPRNVFYLRGIMPYEP